MYIINLKILKGRMVIYLQSIWKIFQIWVQNWKFWAVKMQKKKKKKKKEIKFVGQTRNSEKVGGQFKILIKYLNGTVWACQVANLSHPLSLSLFHFPFSLTLPMAALFTPAMDVVVFHRFSLLISLPTTLLLSLLPSRRPKSFFSPLPPLSRPSPIDHLLSPLSYTPMSSHI